MAVINTYDECFFINYDSCTDLQLYEIGCHACPPSYSFGPIIRNHYIFHYLLSGKGILTLNKKEYPVHSNQGFIIPPNVLAYYIADHQDPWNYIWIHIDGPQAYASFQEAGLHKDSPVFGPPTPPKDVDAIMREFLSIHDRELYCIGKTYELLDCLRHYSKNNVSPNPKLAYIKKIIGFIHVKYSDHFRMDDLAYVCGLERSYMTKLFKNATGYTPQEYLLSYRMKQARLMLEEGELSIQNIAYSVGYVDSFTFSKAFKRYEGISPLEYRMKNRKTE